MPSHAAVPIRSFSIAHEIFQLSAADPAALQKELARICRAHPAFEPFKGALEHETTKSHDTLRVVVVFELANTASSVITDEAYGTLHGAIAVRQAQLVRRVERRELGLSDLAESTDALTRAMKYHVR